jgi:hypothetical protein
MRGVLSECTTRFALYSSSFRLDRALFEQVRGLWQFGGK